MNQSADCLVVMTSEQQKTRMGKANQDIMSPTYAADLLKASWCDLSEEHLDFLHPLHPKVKMMTARHVTGHRRATCPSSVFQLRCVTWALSAGSESLWNMTNGSDLQVSGKIFEPFHSKAHHCHPENNWPVNLMPDKKAASIWFLLLKMCLINCKVFHFSSVKSLQRWSGIYFIWGWVSSVFQKVEMQHCDITT